MQRERVPVLLKTALLAWGACLFYLHSRQAFDQYGLGPLTYLKQLAAQASPGPHFFGFWTGHLARCAACLSFFLGAWALGRRLLQATLKPGAEIAAGVQAVFGVGLGLGVAAYGAFGLIVLGLTDRWLLSALYAGFCAFGWLSAIPVWRTLRQNGRPRPRASTSERLALAAIAACLALAFIGTTIPEISYDALVYHLALPQDYLRAGRMIATPHNHFARLPLAASLIYFWGLAAGGVYLAKLMSFAIGVALLASVYAFGAALKGRRLGVYACAVLVSTPLVLYLFWMTNSDLLAAFFAFLSLIGLWQWTRQSPPRPGFLYLSGLFGGLALATKYTAAFSLALPACYCVWSWLGGKRSLRLAHLALYAALLAAPLVPWWARNYALTGNPVSPYASAFFGEKNVDSELLENWSRETRDDSPGFEWGWHLRKTWSDATQGSRDLAFNFIGPFYLAAFFFLFAAWEEEWLRWGVFCFAAAYFLGLSATYITRLLIAGFVPLSLTLAWALMRSASPAPYKKALVALAALILGTNVFLFSRVVLLTDLSGLAVASGRALPAEYLKTARSLYPNPSYGAYEHIGSLPLKPEERLLVAGEARSFYSPRMAIVNAPYDVPVLLSWAIQSTTPEQLLRRLDLEKVGVILDNRFERSRLDSPKYADQRAMRLVTLMLRDSFEMTYSDAWTAVFRRKAR